MTRKELIRTLRDIVARRDSHPLPVVAGWIVGATMADEAGYELYHCYDDIREVAELASELETLDDDTERAARLWQDIASRIEAL